MGTFECHGVEEGCVEVELAKEIVTCFEGRSQAAGFLSHCHFGVLRHDCLLPQSGQLRPASVPRRRRCPGACLNIVLMRRKFMARRAWDSGSGWGGEGWAPYKPLSPKG
jgi:hypothetical protein